MGPLMKSSCTRWPLETWSQLPAGSPTELQLRTTRERCGPRRAGSPRWSPSHRTEWEQRGSRPAPVEQKEVSLDTRCFSYIHSFLHRWTGREWGLFKWMRSKQCTHNDDTTWSFINQQRTWTQHCHAHYINSNSTAYDCESSHQQQRSVKWHITFKILATLGFDLGARVY